MELVDKASIRIVHVEDDDDFADLTAYFLKRAGFVLPMLAAKDGSMRLSIFR